MMSEFELTPLRDEEQDVVHYGSKIINSRSGTRQLLNKDGGRPRNDLRFISTRIVMKRKYQFCRAILIFLVIILVLIICLLLGFYLNETKKQKSEKAKFVPTQVNVKPILPKSLIYVKSFDSFLHEIDSRMFEVVFSNGTILKINGIKAVSFDQFKIESLSVAHSNKDRIRIRFGSHGNMAYVLLGTSAQVNYEWSRDLTSLDIKVYLSSPLSGLDASSYLFTVKLMEYTPLIQVIFKTLGGKGAVDDFPLNFRKRNCGPYLPLRVTKCGSKNIYNGAFLEGQVKLGTITQILPALPWPENNDGCLKQSSENDESTKSNFYIPLPNGIKDELSCNTAVKYFMKTCSVIPIELPTEKICYNISRQINIFGERHFHQLVDIVFTSCVSILTSLVLMCSSLQMEYEPQLDSYSPYFLLSDRAVRKKLCGHSHALQHNPQFSSLSLSVLAFCPTEVPIASSDQVIYLNQSMAVGNMIHINCRGPPEVTLYQLAHTYTGNGKHLTMLKHNFRMCSKCAFEAVVTVRVLDNEVCCKNMCTKDNNTNVCALGRLDLQEKFQFTTHGSLYCHNFLEDFISDTTSLNIKCTESCVNHFTINFKMSNFREREIFYNQHIMCRGSSSQTCSSKFGT